MTNAPFWGFIRTVKTIRKRSNASEVIQMRH
ncbi:hypothetical protein EMIT0347P_40011 [Pseudomonas sp. IT-347P]